MFNKKTILFIMSIPLMGSTVFASNQDTSDEKQYESSKNSEAQSRGSTQYKPKSVKDAIEHLLHSSNLISDLEYSNFFPTYKNDGDDSNYFGPNFYHLFLLNGVELPLLPTDLNGIDFSPWDMFNYFPNDVIDYKYTHEFNDSIYGTNGFVGVFSIDPKKILQYQYINVNYQYEQGIGPFRKDFSYVKGFSSDRFRGAFAVKHLDQKMLTTKDRRWTQSDFNPEVFDSENNFLGIFQYPPTQPVVFNNTPVDAKLCQTLQGENAFITNVGDCLKTTEERLLNESNKYDSVLLSTEYDLSDLAKLEGFFVYGRQKKSDFMLPPWLLVENYQNIQGNLVGRYLYELGHFDNTVKSDQYLGMVALKGLINGQRWKTSLGYSQQNLTSLSEAPINEENRKSLMSGFGIDLLKDPLSKSMVDQLQGVSSQKLKTSYFQWANKLSGSLFEVKSGVISYATYLSMSYIKRSGKADDDTLRGRFDEKYLNIDTRSLSRKKLIIGGELKVPFSNKLKATFVTRASSLSDVEKSGLKLANAMTLYYQPLNSLAFRLGVAEGYQDPALGKSVFAHNKIYSLGGKWRPTQDFFIQGMLYKEITDNFFGKSNEKITALSLTVDYEKTLSNLGSVTVNFMTEYLFNKDVLLTSGYFINDTGSQSRWRPTLSLKWDYKRWETKLNIKYVKDRCGLRFLSTCLNKGRDASIKGYTTTDLAIKYKLTDATLLKFKINNLLDKSPVLNPESSNPPYNGSGEVMRRSLSLGINYRF